MDGVLIINKEQGYTSNDVVQCVRKILHTKSVGHAGTLDPLATGVLPILVGRGTKLSKYLMEHNKTYVAKICLGEKKDTGDLEGKTIETAKVMKLDENTIQTVLNSFLGKQKQIPPMYSAIKKNGKKLYEYAREGIEVERTPRDIEITSIKLIDFNESTICFEVDCSKGTYIRVLCEDIAEKLGTVGYMSSLIRTRVNKFSLSEAVTLDKIENIENTSCGFYSIEKIFKDKKAVVLKPNLLTLFLNGGFISIESQDELYRVYNEQEKFVGIGVSENGKMKRDVIVLS